MTLKTLESMTKLVANGVDDQEDWIDTLGQELQEGVGSLVGGGGPQAQQTMNVLHGTWLGHPLHPALIVLPAGSWTAAAFLDLLGVDDGADTAIGLGILSSLPTALAGIADWSYTAGKTRRLGVVHALLNSAALGLYGWSWAARRSGHRGLGIGLSTAGLGVMVLSAYLGGEISYALGQGVNRNAWSPDVGETTPEVDEFHVVARANTLPEGELASGELSVEGARIPLVLLKRGDEVFAINATCSHMGGPLADGKLVDGECVECPWHGSRFSLRDGNVVQGPAAYPQPSYEARVRAGNVEVRHAH